MQAKVVNTIDVTNGGEIPVSGVIATLTSYLNSPPRFAAVLKLDGADLRLPVGVRGEAAVYTDRVPFAGTFRKGMLRSSSILNYLAWGT